MINLTDFFPQFNWSEDSSGDFLVGRSMLMDAKVVLERVGSETWKVSVQIDNCLIYLNEGNCAIDLVQMALSEGGIR